jgi:hypothetical protein
MIFIFTVKRENTSKKKKVYFTTSKYEHCLNNPLKNRSVFLTPSFGKPDQKTPFTQSKTSVVDMENWLTGLVDVE